MTRDLDRHQAPENQADDEFARWKAGLSEEMRAVLKELEDHGAEDAIYGAFWVAREAGRL